MITDTRAAIFSYASVWKRFVALLIDSVIFSTIGIAFIFIVLDVSPASYIIMFLYMFVGQWLYFALMESLSGATIGKKTLGMIVIDLEGNRITFLRATGRYFGKFLSGILLIGYIMAFFSDKKQGLHDILAGTLVVDGLSPEIINAKEMPLTPEADSMMLDLNATTEKTEIDTTLDAFGSREPLQQKTETKATQPEAKSLSLPPGAKTCLSCGTVIGQYQTKCHRCGAKLKKGLL